MTSLQPQAIAPELDLLPQPKRAIGVPTHPASADMLRQLAKLRDELVKTSSKGRFVDAASREWRELPINWRMALLLIAGVGQETDLSSLASRNWQELPPTEREEVQAVVRAAKRHFVRLVALAARV